MAEELDLRGLKCPLPVLRTQKRLAAMPAGAMLRVLADDPLAGIDIPHLCREDGHVLVETLPSTSGGIAFTIRRGIRGSAA
ncbi:sulfurtransferase TusA family protein [Mangrovibrevibacter kandeliae]|uniref:sulfurtransferase TusA family protein n=1 Tax=Mangrovibrevibacter kandeliae TaxID=2968473 RepID=UPI0021183E9B|nr:sulfurtransferase TusA family protein [Aurantimonas sp. CSK15Z-1]